MDTELARTFLAIVDGGSFAQAAERLHVTQSTVSMRIRTLEQQLGASLFVRNKAGAAVTDEGQRFRKHADALVRTVEQARNEVGLPEGYTERFTVGGRIALWDTFLSEWLASVRDAWPSALIHAEIGFETDLLQGVSEGRFDIAVMYTPQQRASLDIVHLFDEHLVLARSTEGDGAYIRVDWGDEFQLRQGTPPQALENAGVSFNIGWLCLQHILRHGGSGYLPSRIVAPFVRNGTLTIDHSQPTHPLSAYAVKLKSNTDGAFARAWQSLLDAGKRQ